MHIYYNKTDRTDETSIDPPPMYVREQDLKYTKVFTYVYNSRQLSRIQNLFSFPQIQRRSDIGKTRGGGRRGTRFDSSNNVRPWTEKAGTGCR